MSHYPILTWFQIPKDDVNREVCIESVRGDVNGMAFWMVWNLDGVNSVSSGGPVGKVKVGENVDWDVHSKQGRWYFSSVCSYSVDRII